MAFSFLYDRYVLKSLGLATAFTACTLAAIILLTQSLRFLELIINSGASSAAFWMLAFLALPRFFEVILPIALMISTVFIYSRMISDSEVVVMRAAGTSPMKLARPALVMALLTTFLLLFITMWLAPASLSSMQKMRQVIKAQYSTLLFREGIFNEAGKDLTVYIENRTSEGELEGLLIHDSRKELPAPVTVLAKRGVIVATDEGQQVLVYDGSRQDFNEKTGALNRLDFERYTIDLPEAAAVRKRWREPDERTFWELLNPNPENPRDMENEQKFLIEAHRRVVGPFLALSFTAVVLCCLLLGPVNRRGQAKRIFFAVGAVIVLQSLYLAVFNFTFQSHVPVSADLPVQKGLPAHSFWGLILMYVLVFTPVLVSMLFLSRYGENIRHKILYATKPSDPIKAEGTS